MLGKAERPSNSLANCLDINPMTGFRHNSEQARKSEHYGIEAADIGQATNNVGSRKSDFKGVGVGEGSLQ